LGRSVRCGGVGLLRGIGPMMFASGVPTVLSSHPPSFVEGGWGEVFAVAGSS